MLRYQVSNFKKKGSSNNKCLGMPGPKMPLASTLILVRLEPVFDLYSAFFCHAFSPNSLLDS